LLNDFAPVLFSCIAKEQKEQNEGEKERKREKERRMKREVRRMLDAIKFRSLRQKAFYILGCERLFYDFLKPINNEIIYNRILLKPTLNNYANL